MLPLLDSVSDRITPSVWRRRRGQRGGLLLPLPPPATRQGGHTSGPDLGEAEQDGPSQDEEEEEEMHPTPIKDAPTTPS